MFSVGENDYISCRRMVLVTDMVPVNDKVPVNELNDMVFITDMVSVNEKLCINGLVAGPSDQGVCVAIERLQGSNLASGSKR